MSINANAKGKRIERGIVQWLKESGLPTAKRTEQYCGNMGTADIDCIELHTWHIESKGTKTGLLTGSILRNWLKQVENDCPPDKKWVVVNTPNGKNRIAMLPFETWLWLSEKVMSTFKFSNIDYHVSVGNSINPNDLIEFHTQIKSIEAAINSSLKKSFLSDAQMTRAIVYCPIWAANFTPDKLVVFVKADEWLERAKKQLGLS